MRLTKFIDANHEKIIGEWIEFAATLVPWAKGMSEKDLRDHAEELLTAVVKDMEAPQSKIEQSDKSQGLTSAGALASVGHKHASQRLDTGFNLDQLLAEYRALRASVLRLWEESTGNKQNDVTRFNEAIDESLTESTTRYSEILDRTREQFLAMLGHDLRTPLGAIVMGASLLTRTESLDDRQARVAARILNSAHRMDRMVSDLLDFTRTRLGTGIPITTKAMDAAPVCEQVVAELGAIHPDSTLRLELRGDLRGEWDSDRLNQVISNLVANALQYGGEDGPVIFSAEGHPDEVVLRVRNTGATIPAATLKKMFEPMVRHSSQSTDRNATGLGLGLYIAREVVTAHRGSIDVTSTAKDGTTFTVRLPRRPSPRRDA
ncbi:MAG: sensor histidine kinase [Sandaracinaceae bacterium]|nr:sensor histidine kinase [Sandaracinaceae bacterium]